jgi:hypothetical protein
MAYGGSIVSGSEASADRALALLIWIIIRLIQLVFSAGTVFFAYKKSASSIFQPAYNSSRTGLLLFRWMIDGSTCVCNSTTTVND